MADYAVMPYADYEDACEAVREKTGGTEVIKSGDMGAQIRAIDTQEDLSEELSEQDTLIADIMTALEGKSAASGAEVVTGTYTLSSQSNGSITIPGLIGKDNFIIILSGNMAVSSLEGWVVSYSKLSEENTFRVVLYSPNGGNNYGATTSSSSWDSSTGTLTYNGSPVHKFVASDWFYIGW